MAKRRFQNPQPERRGVWWTMRIWRDELVDGKRVRKQLRIRLAAATLPVREVRKIAAEYLRPLNQGLESLGSATNFEHFIETIYKPVVKPLMATTSFDRTRGVLDTTLFPPSGRAAFGNSPRLHSRPTSQHSRPARRTKCSHTSRETKSVTCFRARYVSLCSTICW